MRIALATCKKLPEPDKDEGPLLEALKALGAEAELVAWDGGRSLEGFDACVIRSTWNYIHHYPEFLAWTERAARQTRLYNPPAVVRWNSDKRYLADFAALGVNAVPTAYAERGGPGLAGLIEGKGWGDLVLKPRVGAGSFMTRRFAAAERAEAQAFLEELLSRGDALIQPYFPSVEGEGERCLVWIAGELTHAVRKRPRLADDEEAVELVPISQEERSFALKVLEPWAKELLYARVDVARDPSGRLAVMELELVEPSLFLTHSAAAMRRLAGACLRA